MTEKGNFKPPARRKAAGVGGVIVTVTAALAVIGAIWAGINGFFTSGFVLAERCTATSNGQAYRLSPEQAQNAALITSLAVERDLPARAATIALATAVQESDLRNITYGDRDSVGLFQQRPSQGWGTVDQIMDPVYSTNKFYDGLVKIDGYETMVITEAAQKVQRSGFPRAYADHEPEGRAYASALTGYSDRSLDCKLRPVGSNSAGTVGDRLATITKGLPSYSGNNATSNPDKAHVEITVTDPRVGWATAHYAVAHAKNWDVNSVEYDGSTWDRSKPNDGWVSKTASGADATKIVITVAR